ncbi:MAG: hypothetical protein JW967_10595 [Dehalococcoidales bacterium]|nr:hypothetical protein [Dehalococcoidales bacterium]
MSSKDFRHREQKKPKKGAKKEIISSIATPVPEVEIIKKVRKPREEEEE